jgi:hypothetical protein
MKDTQLSENTTVEQYQQSEKNNDRQALAKFIREGLNWSQSGRNRSDSTSRSSRMRLHFPLHPHGQLDLRAFQIIVRL